MILLCHDRSPDNASLHRKVALHGDFYFSHLFFYDWINTKGLSQNAWVKRNISIQETLILCSRSFHTLFCSSNRVKLIRNNTYSTGNYFTNYRTYKALIHAGENITKWLLMWYVFCMERNPFSITTFSKRYLFP